MTENISLSVFGTFGSPNGFTQSIAGPLQEIKKYDLNSNAIKIFDSTVEIYALRKEILGTIRVVSFVKYSYASEQGSSRGGTFVGASVINSNGVADIKGNISILDKLHGNLISNSKNVNNGLIMVRHSKEFIVDIPNANNLIPSIEQISDIDFSEKGENLVVFISLKNMQENFSKCLDLLNNYDTIYFTEDEQVGMYVNKKGLYDLIQEVGDLKELTERLKTVEEEKVQRQKAVVTQLLKNIESVKSEKEILIKSQKDAIELNKEIHRKNDEKIKNAEKKIIEYSSSFDAYVARMSELSKKLEGRQLKQSERLQIESELREISSSFEKEKRKFKEPERLESFKHSRVHQSTHRPYVNHYGNDDERDHRVTKKTDRFSAKDIAIILGVVLILVGGGYFVWYLYNKQKEEQANTSSTSDGSIDTAANENSDTLKIKLNPKPNGFLGVSDTQKTIEMQLSSDQHLPVDSVVLRIFKANPTDIGSKYKGQETEYGEYLIQKNTQNFDANKKLINTANLQFPIYTERKKDNADSVKMTEPAEPSTVENLSK